MRNVSQYSFPGSFLSGTDTPGCGGTRVLLVDRTGTADPSSRPIIATHHHLTCLVK